MNDVESASVRLREIAERLRDPGLPAAEAEALAREAADLLARASAELERALRESPGESR